jgi:DNA-binding CsgD family transcriptional regulator
MGHLAGEEVLGEAWLEAARGRVGPARAALLEAAAVARASGHACSEALLLTDVARLGDPGGVAPRLAELAESVQGPFAAARADFAAALARQDPDGLLRSHEAFRTFGAHVLAAEAASAAAAALNRAGNARQATSAARLARDSAELCPGVCTPLHILSLTAPSLTAREREIAGLAAGGLPSKEIARDLHLSVRTVDNHLRRIYDKLGVSTRRELAAVLV